MRAPFIHNTFRVGDFWSYTDTPEIRGRCHLCNTPKTLEHIALDCDTTPDRKIMWSLTVQLWSGKYADWPTWGWGLILGCNQIRFKSPKGTSLPGKARLFAILVSIVWYLTWSLRGDRVVRNPEMIPSAESNQNCWLKAVNTVLQRDCILTNKTKFGPLVLKKQLVLNIWSTNG
ncbi:hypothetical protein C8J57DRAFT_1079970 [Mycena rebaudengoi]|nr:hypothetical protein C8J57DRAFT_1079970 [Mycena rebaudengoi]